ncbi:MAG: hypothetical protein Q7R35_00915 [Elusimicrobiota bacterium]|nr:hypothetical protein [Elusimicrobiota bacterium]
MTISAYIVLAAVINLAAFVSYPYSGRFGFTFLYLSMILWAAAAIFINHAANCYGTAWKVTIAAGFALMCAFATLSFLPQADGVTPLEKFTSGNYPDKKTLYIGLLKLGVDAPGLLTP